MTIYEETKRWKWILFIIAFTIVNGSILYTNTLAKKLGDEEKKKIQRWADIIKRLSSSPDNTDIGLMDDIIRNNTTVPAILVDQDSIINYRNLDSIQATRDTGFLREQIALMKNAHDPIEIEIADGIKNYIYYSDSALLKELRYYPYVQFGVIAIFVLIAYFLFNTARRSEQNRVWVGMAKETAHQLGTPLTSLSGWVEHLRESGTVTDPRSAEILNEMENDVDRLVLVAERFSKIGSAPELNQVDVVADVQSLLDYLRRRISTKVEMNLMTNKQGQIIALMNAPLFNWVIENLLKNAMDAMEGKGKIDIFIKDESHHVIIEVTDNGKGIPKSKMKTVFKPGYSTKKRGWGLGLSLSKRILEQYHKGKIFVKSSTLGSGTTFRIVLNK